MQDDEMRLFYELLDLLNKKKSKNKLLFNNPKTKFLYKDERFIPNNITKGLILYELNDYYIVDIYIDNGVDNIVNGLLNLIFDDLSEAKKQYEKSLQYLDQNSIMKILEDGKEKLLAIN